MKEVQKKKILANKSIVLKISGQGNPKHIVQFF